MSVLLDARDIHVSFGGVHAVNGVSFQIHTGETLGLIGPNGSGKSSCVNIISGVYPLDSGSIYFDGRQITNKHRTMDRALMGICRTFQTPKPFQKMTVYDSIYAIALLKYSHQEAGHKTEHILEMTKLGASRNIFSEKLPIEKRKWLDLARSLACEPKLIMMDEVLGGLNHTEQEESIELVRQINKAGVTILFIEHIIRAVVDLCGRVVVLNEGKLLAEGNPHEVLQRHEVIAAYIGEGKTDAEN